MIDFEKIENMTIKEFMDKINNACNSEYSCDNCPLMDKDGIDTLCADDMLISDFAAEYNKYQLDKIVRELKEARELKNDIKN